MKLSETIWRLSLVENVKDKLTKIQAASDKAALGMDKLQGKLGKIGEVGRAALGQVENSLPSVGGGITQFITNPMVAAGIATVAVGAKAVQMSMQFSEGMAKINNTAQLPQGELNKIRDQLIDIGKEGSGGNLMRLPDSFEKINSQVNDTRLSMDILKVSVKSAKSGFADLDVVSGAVAQSLSAIGQGKASAKEVVDTLMSAKRTGAGEFQDFATYIPQLIAQGRNLGIGFKDVAGTFAYMTAKGQTAADSAMLIQNAYGALGKSEIQNGLKKIGVDIFDSKGAIKSFDAIFTQLEAKTKGLSDKQKTMLFEGIGLMDIQAKQAFSVLMGDSKKLSSIMGDVRNSAGEVDRAVAATANPMTQLHDMGDKFGALMLELGNAILPGVTAAISWIANGFFAVVQYIQAGWQRATLLQDVFWLIGEIIGGIWEGVKGIGNVFLWVYEHTIKPIADAINWVYEKVKDLLGLSGKQVAISATVNGQKIEPPTNTSKLPSDIAAPKMSAAELASLNNNKQGVDSIHGGGSQTRNINVVIHKFQDSIQIHTANLKEGAEDMRKIIEETLIRAINGAEMAVSNG